MTTATRQDPRVLRDRIASDPDWFLREILGSALHYGKQVEIAESVRDNPKTSVAGCNGSGKDWLAGRVVPWWLLSRYPAKAVIMGPTHRQVADIVWKETRMAYFQARTPLGGRMMETPKWNIDDSHFAIGFSTDKWENIQGFHSPNLLVIITEGHAVSKDDIDALMKLQPKRVLMTGNTLVMGGEFYDSHHSKRDQWHTITIKAGDTPNVQHLEEIVPGLITQEWIDERALDWGEDSPIFRAAVHAEFPDDLEGTVVPLRYANLAAAREGRAEGPVIYACDVASSGTAKTVVIRRQGWKAEIVHKAQGHDVMRTSGVLKGLHDKERESRIVVDMVGLGEGVYYRLRELGVSVIGFKGGETAWDSRQYMDRNAECWWLMRKWIMEQPSQIPNDPALIGQMSSRKYEIQSDRKIKLESKKDMEKRGIRSPDEADSLAMTFMPLIGGGPVRSAPKQSRWRS